MLSVGIERRICRVVEIPKAVDVVRPHDPVQDGPQVHCAGFLIKEGAQRHDDSRVNAALDGVQSGRGRGSVDFANERLVAAESSHQLIPIDGSAQRKGCYIERH